MDPNLFHLDWERTFEVLATIIVLAFLIERALAIVFEHRLFIERFDQSGMKEFIALAVSIAICATWHFDAMSMIVLQEQTSTIGYVITGAIVAGGSKASMKLFHDVLKMKSTAYENRHEIRAQRAVEEADEALAAAPAAKTPQAAARLAKDATKAKKEAQRAAQSSDSPLAQAALLKTSKVANELNDLVEKRTEEVAAKVKVVPG